MRLFVLGAADPEMAAIESLLSAAGEQFCYATVGGVRCHPGNAYKADDISDGHAWGAVTHLVECAPPAGLCEHCGDLRDMTPHGLSYNLGIADAGSPGGQGSCGDCHSWIWPIIRPTVVVVDHHRPDDPGYGLSPADFVEASSIGQVVDLLGGNCPVLPDGTDVRLVAAADHCLDAAYRGLCPGVDPDELMRWRARSRAAFQKREVADVIRDIEAATKRLTEAATDWAEDESQTGYIAVGKHKSADLRGYSIPELPEASARCGIPFLSDVSDRDGRKKVVLMGCGQHPDLLAQFMSGTLVPGLVDIYGGDPTRGFAGGYYPA